MTIEYDIYLPTKSSDGRPIDGKLLEDIRSTLIESFGGLTDTRLQTDGFWKSGGVTILDEILIWRVLSDQGKAGDEILERIKVRLEDILKQEKILVVKRVVETL